MCILVHTYETKKKTIEKLLQGATGGLKHFSELLTKYLKSDFNKNTVELSCYMLPVVDSRMKQGCETMFDSSRQPLKFLMEK